MKGNPRRVAIPHQQLIQYPKKEASAAGRATLND